MFHLTDTHIEFIIADVINKGITQEALQEDIVDHVCCIIEVELKEEADFNSKYNEIINRFFKKELKELQEETDVLQASKTIDVLKKALQFSGVFSVVFLAIGIYTKFNYIKGAGMLVLVGMLLFSLVFLPALILLKLKDNDVRENIVLVILGFLLVLLGGVGCLFKIMEWPFATNLLWLSLAGLVFVFTPLYYSTVRKKPGNKLKAFINTVLLLVVGMLLFVLTVK